MADAIDREEAAAILQRSGRPRLLSWLKERLPDSKLAERQTLASSIAKAVKDGSLKPSASALKDADALTQLMHAAASGDVATARTLLDASDQTLGKPKDGATALMAAAGGGHVEVVRLLLSEGYASLVGDVNARRTHDGWTAAMVSIKAGHVACLRLLLDANAATDLINNDGWSALMIACEADAHDSVDALLAAGASPTKGIHNGWAVVLTPLKLACIGGHARCVRMLLGASASLGDADGSRLDIIEADGSTMLIYAAQRTHHRSPRPGDGHAEVVRLLLAATAQPDQTRWDGLTPLAYAAIYGDVSSAHHLLAARADVSRADEAGWTPLLWAALHGHAPLVELLLAHAASPDEARPNGCTALMAACISGAQACASVLLGARADVTRAMGSGHSATALMLAARHGHADCVRCMLDESGGQAGNGDCEARRVDARGWAADAYAEAAGFAALASVLRSVRNLETRDADVGLAVCGTIAAEPPTEAQRRGARRLFQPIPGLSHLDAWQERAGGRLGGRRPGDPKAGEEEGADDRAPAPALSSQPGSGPPPLLPPSAPAPPKYYVSSTHPHFANLLQLHLLAHGYERATRWQDDWSLSWYAGQIDPNILRQLRPHQVVNKFPHSSCLTTKSSLWTTYERMHRRHGASHYGFVPPTVLLPEGAADLRAAMADEAASAPSSAARGADCVWIVKPVAACRGQGITLHRSADGLPHDVGARRAIASRYVHPPYLVGGRKVDLRLYVLVTSWRPLVIYLHDLGLCRLATEQYALTELDAPSKHISLASFRAHLAADRGEACAAAAMAAIDDALVKMLIAAEPPMGQAVSTYVPNNGCRCFQLFGFDVMLDDACRPWIIEANLDPSLATDAPLDLQVKAGVLTDLLNIVAPRAPDATAAPPPNAAAGKGSPSPPKAAWDGLSAQEVETVKRVDDELSRAAEGGWRRLHPSARSARGEYAQFFEGSRVGVHTLPFEV